MRVWYPDRELIDPERAELVEIALIGADPAEQSRCCLNKRKWLVCTRQSGHSGWHVGHGAHASTAVLAVWLDD